MCWRAPGKRTMSKALTLSGGSRRGGEELWRHSREPLKQPLLRKLHGKEELAEEACHAFTATLKYCGDLPAKRRTSYEYTDHIFDPPLKHVIITTSICQVLISIFFRGPKWSNFIFLWIILKYGCWQWFFFNNFRKTKMWTPLQYVFFFRFVFDVKYLKIYFSFRKSWGMRYIANWWNNWLRTEIGWAKKRAGSLCGWRLAYLHQVKPSSRYTFNMNFINQESTKSDFGLI